MIIEYKVSNFVEETKSFEIEDTKNVFLEGTNPYNGLSTYFGIWSNGNYLVIATIINGRCFSYDYSTNSSIYTENDIKKYLTNNKNVKVISKKVFAEQLNRFKEIIEI